MSHPTVLWQITRACSLDCTHCPTHEDEGRPGSEELSTFEAFKTVDQIASLQPRELIITGGDPLARHDVLQIIDYAKRRGLKPAVALSATPNLTPQAIDTLRASGATTLIFALHAASASHHDALSGYIGSYEQTIGAIHTATAAGIPVEIDTLITHRNVSDIPALGGLLAELEIAAWNVHFIVPIGTSRKLEILTPEESEHAFEALAAVQRKNRFRVRTVEAPEYRRYLLQNRDAAEWSDFASDYSEDIAGCSMDDVVFIGASGAVRPSEFLPIAAGNVRFRPLFGIVRGSDLFVAVRDRSNLIGKCSRCEYKEVCGGSRARAWAMTGLLFGPDPLCAFQPKEAAREATT
ncbi:MAG: radical SAM protein [Thermoanaerobaculia bacterium]